MLLDVQQFESYLFQVQQIALRNNGASELNGELKHVIDAEKSHFHEDPNYQEFFQGEEAFFSGDHEQSLQHYLQAKSIPFFKFFCYRASAHISKMHNELQKAQLFAEKSLSIYPQDVSCLLLLLELLDQETNSERIKEIQTSLRNIAEGSQESGKYSDHTTNKSTYSTSLDSYPYGEETSSYSTSNGNDVSSIQPSTHSIHISELQKLAHRNTSGEKEMLHTDSEEERQNRLNIEKALSARIQEYQERQSYHLNEYLERYKKRQAISDNCLYVLQGWNKNHSTSNAMLTEQARKTTGGFFIRWNGKGIVLNPGIDFLENFHQQGLHIKDIDYVIVTGDDPASYSNIKEIYELNYQLNRVNSELQIINYYLCQKAYQSLTRLLKPNFKQERNTIHCLELFLDSPDLEKIELSSGIVLHYFPISMQETYFQNPGNDERSPKYPSSIGIRLELKNPYATQSDKSTTRLAYISGVSWSPMLAHHLGSCDLLITGFGSTNPNDYGKLKYNEDSCLGYFGTYSLLEEVQPQLLICAELSGNDGDIRLEIAKKMRQDYLASASSKRAAPAILPSDNKLFIDLKSLKVRCSVSQALIDPNHIRIVKTDSGYGNLHYLSPLCSS